MLFNLYSSLPLPLEKAITQNSILYTKLTTMVFTSQTEHEYLHIYENKNGIYRYLRTIKVFDAKKVCECVPSSRVLTKASLDENNTRLDVTTLETGKNRARPYLRPAIAFPSAKK